MTKTIFFVEGKKTEIKLLMDILCTYFESSEVDISVDTSEEYCLLENKNKKFYIKWLPSGNVNRLHKELINDEFCDGITLSNIFEFKSEEFAYEFLLIDADLNDNMPGNLTKKDMLEGLFNKVERMGNSYLLVSSPAVEAFIDPEKKYEFVTGEKYKRTFTRRFGSKFNSGDEFTKIDKYLKLNINKFRDLKVKYDEQREFVITSIEDKLVYILSCIHHIICEIELIDESDLLESLPA